MLIQNYKVPQNSNTNQYHKNIHFKGIKPTGFDFLFDEFYFVLQIDDKDLVKLFPGKLNIAKDFLNLENYDLDIISILKDKTKTEFKYLYDLASKEDSAGTIRIPAENLKEFANISYEKLKFIEPIILSKKDIGLWNYTPEYILNLTQLDDKRLYTFVELAKCNVTPLSTNAILQDTDINWTKTIEAAKNLKQLYGKSLREVEFYSNSKGENFFLADIQLPHTPNKTDWQNYKRITVKLDDDVNPINKKKTNTHIEKYINTIYEKINHKLQIFSHKDLDNTIKIVQSKCNEATEEEILTTIKKLTQFSSYKSLQQIGKQLQEQGITELANLGELYKYFNYFHEHKQLFELKNSPTKKIGIIFTPNDTANSRLMTELKKSKDHPAFEQILFINLEGFSDGVNLFTDNKKLPELTMKVLNEAKKLQKQTNNLTFDECVSEVLNKKVEQPLKKLGFNVHTVNFNTSSSKEAILNQMQPIMPTKDLIRSTIESIADKYSPEKHSYKKLSHLIAEYYEQNVNIYSKQSIIEDLKKLNQKIELYMEQNNIQKENLYIIEHQLEFPKSYEIINRMYKDLFNLPDEKIIKLKSITDINKYPENSTFIILDDIVGSGKSFIEIGEYYKEAPLISKQKHILFVPITATEKGINLIQENINNLSRKNIDNIILLAENMAPNTQNFHIFNNIFFKLMPAKFYQILNKGFGKQGLCTAFPYMAPDNNAYISSNFVKLFLPSSNCIKSMPDTFKEIETNSIYYNLFGLKKEKLNPNPNKIQLPAWIEKVKDFFFNL